MWRNEITASLLLTAATLVAYALILDNGFVGYDDELYLTANSMVQRGLTWDGFTWAFGGFEASNWHPLTWLSHMLDVELFGMKPTGHHAMALVLHTLNGLLLFGLLRWLTGSVWRSISVAALFALHPLHVESVAWAASRKDLLSTAFLLGAMLFYVAWVRRRKLGFYAGLFFCFALSLMAKPMGVTLPFLLLLLDAWPLSRLGSGESAGPAGAWKVWKPRILEKLPLLALSVASSVITLLAQRGAVESLEIVPLWARIGNALLSYGGYIIKVLWPTGLAVHYPHPGTDLPWPWVIGALLMVAGLSFVAWEQRRSSPYLLVGWLWFVGMLVPVIGLVQVGSQAMADRYSYLPHVGLFIMLVWSVAALTAELQQRQVMLAVGGGIVVLALSLLTREQSLVWRDGVTLFSHAVAVTGPNALAQHKLGQALASAGRGAEAQRHLEAALVANPNYAAAHNDLGIIKLNQGDLDAAVEHFEIALRSEAHGPRAHVNMGVVLERQEEFGKAMVHYRSAVHLDPELIDARNNLGILMVRAGRTRGALPHLQKAVELAPNDAEVHNNYGFALWIEGQIDPAAARFREAMRLQPSMARARNNLAMMLRGDRPPGVPEPGSEPQKKAPAQPHWMQPPEAAQGAPAAAVPEGSTAPATD